MKGQTEKAFRELEAYLSKHQDEIGSDADVERLVAAFMEERGETLRAGFMAEKRGERTADGWLEEAQEAPSGKKRLECVRKALQLEPENLDADRMEIEEECGDDQDALRERFSAALARADAAMARDGWFGGENVGAFWVLFETRPYMRLRCAYFETLSACGMVSAAIREGNEMLRLCESDNLGIRYRLMHLYAMLEAEEPMLALHRAYDEYDETQMLLPLSIVCYKTGKEERAKEYLLRLLAVNPGAKKFMRHMSRGNLDFLREDEDSPGCRPFTLQELAREFRENTPLFVTCPGYFSWADRQLSALKGKAGRKKGE